MSRHSEHLQIVVIGSVLVLALARTCAYRDGAGGRYFSLVPHHGTSNGGFRLCSKTTRPVLAKDGAAYSSFGGGKGQKKKVDDVKTFLGKKKKKEKKFHSKKKQNRATFPVVDVE